MIKLVEAAVPNSEVGPNDSVGILLFKPALGEFYQRHADIQIACQPIPHTTLWTRFMERMASV